MALLHQPRRDANGSTQSAQIRHGEPIGVSFELASRGERLRAVGTVKRARRQKGLVEIGIEFEKIGLNAYKRLVRISDSTQILENARSSAPPPADAAVAPWRLVAEFVQSFSEGAMTRIGERLLLHAEHAEDVVDRAPYFYALIDLRARSKEISDRFVRHLCARISGWSRDQHQRVTGTPDTNAGATVVSILSGTVEADKRQRTMNVIATEALSGHTELESLLPAPYEGATAQMFTRFIQTNSIVFDSRLLHSASAPLAPRTITDLYLQASDPFGTEAPIDRLTRETLDELLRLHYLKLTRGLARLN